MIGSEDGHRGPDSELIGCHQTARTAHAARTDHCVPARGQMGNGFFGAFPEHRTQIKKGILEIFVSNPILMHIKP